MPEEPTKAIHIRIRDLRRERALTQEELAEALGLSRQSINAMEAGRCLPSLPVAMQIASFFSVPLNRIFQLEAEALQPSQQNQTAVTRKESAMSNMVPWSPLREMREALDELMDETMQWPAITQVSAPAVNVSQNATHVFVELRAPGYTKDDLSIEVGDDFVTIVGEAKKEQEKDERQYFRREFVSQHFTRTLSLPAVVQSEKAEAEMKHGILHIQIPKVVEEKPKTAKINIKAAE